MAESKIISYLEDMSSRERERFNQFVHSPYFNQHEKTRELLQIILDTENNIPREVLFEKLFPGDAFDEQQLYNVLSSLKKLYHQFLAVEYWTSEPLTQELATVSACFERNQFELMLNRSKLMEKMLDKYPHRDSHYYQIQFQLQHKLGYYHSNYVKRTDSSWLQTMYDTLDHYFIAEKLKHACHMLANSMLMNTHFEYGFLDAILAFVKQKYHLLQNEYSVRLYYTIYLSLTQPENPAHYHDLKEMLAHELDCFPKMEATDLFSFANNYCIQKINSGNTYFQKELFDLYKRGLEAQLLFQNGVLSEWNYKNIATLGASLKEFLWTEDFLHAYKVHVPASKRENAFMYNLANLYYHKGLYDETLETLRTVQFTDIKYHLNTYFLVLRTHYAKQDTEALLSLVETFRIYVIRNQKMTTSEKRSYTNFLRFAKKLAMLKHQPVLGIKGKEAALKSLALKIQDAEPIINKQWLLEECILKSE